MSGDSSAGPAPVHSVDAELAKMKGQAAAMGALALGMVRDGWRAFRSGDLAAAQKVLDRDAELDRLDQEAEHEVIGFLVRRQPAASDLRTAAALLKITTYLDRIGRLGFDIARVTRPREEGTSVPPNRPLEEMAEEAGAMVERALEALGKGDAELARELIGRDDRVDRMYRQGTEIVVARLEREPSAARFLSREILVLRHFERIADNACKIAERTIYAATGQRRGEYLPRHPNRPDALEGKDLP